MRNPNTLDTRIIEVGIEVNGKIRTYSELGIAASGVKYANQNQNECTLQIANLKKDVRDFILTETSPFNKNRTPKSVILKAGRPSYGVSVVYVGNIVTSTPSQPPDIWLELKCLTGNYQKGNVLSRGAPPTISLSDLGKQVAGDLGVGYTFQATDKQIANYNFSGGALGQVNKLQEIGGVDAYVDDSKLILKDINIPLTGVRQKVSEKNGMVGIPEITEVGVKVKFMLSPQTALGGVLQVESTLNPAANGSYVIYKLGFEIATRAEPFWWIAEAKRL